MVLPYVNMNPPWVYTCSPSWTPSHLPPRTIPLVIPVHQAQASCIMHRTWTGDSFQQLGFWEVWAPGVRWGRSSSFRKGHGYLSQEEVGIEECEGTERPRMREPSQNHRSQKSWLVFLILSPDCLSAPTPGNLLSTPTPRFAICGELGDPISALFSAEGWES